MKAIRDERERLSESNEQLEAILSVEGGLSIDNLPKNQKNAILLMNQQHLDKQLLMIQTSGAFDFANSNVIDNQDTFFAWIVKNPITQGAYSVYDGFTDVITSDSYTSTFSYGCSGYSCNLTGFEINDK